MTAGCDMLCSLTLLARRHIKHELGEPHSQSIGNNHEYTIIDNGKQQSSLRTEVSKSAAINHAGRKRAHKYRLGEAAIAQQQRSGGSRMIKIHTAVPGGGVSKKKVSRLADRLSGKKACLVIRVNHSVVSVADLCCCLV